jgi:hypothetical protein
MPVDPFDLEIEKLSAPEVREQRLAREQAERKRRAVGPPDLDPRPPAERDDWRELLRDNGIRIYRQGPDDQVLRQSLESAHYQWEMLGCPENGPTAERLVAALSDAYLITESTGSSPRWRATPSRSGWPMC